MQKITKTLLGSVGLSPTLGMQIPIMPSYIGSSPTLCKCQPRGQGVVDTHPMKSPFCVKRIRRKTLQVRNPEWGRVVFEINLIEGYATRFRSRSRSRFCANLYVSSLSLSLIRYSRFRSREKPRSSYPPAPLPANWLTSYLSTPDRPTVMVPAAHISWELVLRRHHYIPSSVNSPSRFGRPNVDLNLDSTTLRYQKREFDAKQGKK